jgi:hypothetical protein
MKARYIASLTVAALTCLAAASYAHHSFAVHYDPKKIVTIEGIAKVFRFTNPHGILELEVKTDKGETQRWTVETTAPVYMQRRGWSKNTIKPGDRIVVEGWPARDGSHLMRIRKVRLPDGTELGQTNPNTATGE